MAVEGKVKNSSSSSPQSRRAAVKRLVEKGKKLKRTLAKFERYMLGTWDVSFPSIVKSYLQSLLEVLFGEAKVDIQKLQERCGIRCCFSCDCPAATQLYRWEVYSAFQEAMTHPETSPLIKEAVELLLEVKRKLFHLSIFDPQSLTIFGNLLKIIREVLQAKRIPGRSLGESTWKELASLLQKTVQCLEARENRSREEVMEVDAVDKHFQKPEHPHPCPSSKTVNMRAAVKRLVRAKEKLKRTLGKFEGHKLGTWNVPFPSSVKSYLQALLEVLFGEAEVDIQKLQGRCGLMCWISCDCPARCRFYRWEVYSAFQEAMTDPETSPLIEEAVELLLEIKRKLFHPSIFDPLSVIIFGNLLKVIREELQAAQIQNHGKKQSEELGRSLREGTCEDLASLLQKMVQCLEARENRSREEVMEVDTADKHFQEPKHWYPYPSSKTVDMTVASKPPAPRTAAAAKRLQKASKELEKIQKKRGRNKGKVEDRGFQHAIKSLSQALLEVLTGDAAEDFQELQNKRYISCGSSLEILDPSRVKKSKVDSAVKDAMIHPKISVHLRKAMDLLLEVKDALPSRILDQESTRSFVNSLHVLSEKLQRMGTSSGDKVKSFHADLHVRKRQRLEEDECVDYTSLLQPIAEFLDVRENPLSAEFLDVRENRSNTCRWKWMDVRTSSIWNLLALLLLASQLGCTAAIPLTLTAQVQDSGRAEQGKAYNLSCLVEGSKDFLPTFSYVWYKDGTAMRNETKQVLSFSQLTQDDAGNYQCGLNFADGKTNLLSDALYLRVLVFENITMVPMVEVEEGETAIINCSVHSVPTAQLVWTFENKVLRIVDSNFHSLVLHNASQYHLKAFDCQASNSEFFMQFLWAYTQIRIKGTYEVIPKPLLGTQMLPVLHQPFELICLIFDLPQNHVNIHLTYTWFKDNRKILGQSGEVLRFPSLSKEDGGLYQCRARNGDPRTTSPDSNIKDVLVLLPPHVQIEPATPDKVIRHAAGEELILTCKVTEARPWVPHNGYSWSYLPSPRGQLQSLGVRESTLNLGPLIREDSGQYFCQARNDLEAYQGKIPPGNASITVDVIYLEQISLTPDLNVKEGDRLTLSCNVDCNPAPRLSWIVDGRVVRQVTYNVDHYVVERAACSDSKTYTCRASSALLPGLERSASTKVQVACSEDVTRLPSSTPSSSNQDAPETIPETSSTPTPLLWLLVLLLVPLIGAIIMILYRRNRVLHQPVSTDEVDTSQKNTELQI